LIELQRNGKNLRFAIFDLSAENILVYRDDVFGIVDWELSRWYPEYWENAQAKLNYEPFDDFWANEVEKFLNPYPDALEMDNLRL
jgi:hypothetical protein